MKKIFTYLDYRVYLRDYYEEMKRTTSYFSYRWFAQKADLSSAAFLKLVIDDQRNLSPDGVEKFIVGLGLELNEAEYFRALVNFNQAKTNREKQSSYSLMLSMADFVQNHKLTSDQYSYYEKWYTPVIRELICMYPFGDNFQKISSLLVPAVSVNEVRQAVLLMLQLGVLIRDESGNYRQTNTFVTSGSESQSILQMARLSFHQQVISLARDSLENLPKPDRHAIAVTMGVSRSCYEVLIQEMERFKERVLTIVENDRESNQVFQMNMQMFKISESVPLEVGDEK